jgi:hypothetical protein
LCRRDALTEQEYGGQGKRRKALFITYGSHRVKIKKDGK